MKINGPVQHFPPGIGGLTRLHTFVVYGSNPFTMPQDFGNLKKIKRLPSYGQLTNREDFVKDFPHLLT